MAELASGAVSSLLGVIRNEWQLLGRVGSDVQFIREEMESMNSFLMHLARTVPPGGEHDEQVRTWMNQVRLLAQDCNNCIDLYLYRGNPDIHLGKDCLRRYLKFVPWFVQKMVAQHRAALELRDLKERARDVGQRRLRYGVEVPKNKAATEGGEAFVHLVGDDEDDGHYQEVAGTTTASSATDGSGRIRRALFGIYVPEDYLHDKLVEWIKEVERHWAEAEAEAEAEKQQQHNARCVAVVVPSTDDSGAIASQASTVAERCFHNRVLVDIPALHYWSALGPKNVLYYILREIQLQRSNPRLPSSSKGQGEEEVVTRHIKMRMRRVFDWSRKKHIREGKRQAIGEIKKNMETIKVTDKIQEIKTQIQKVTHKQLQQTQEKMKTDEMPELEEASLGVLLVRLHWSSIAAATDETKKKDMPALAESYGTLIKDTADKLNDHMEQVNQEGAEHRILHHVNQYEHILREVFPEVGSDSKRQEQDTKRVTTSEATPADEDQIREIIDKIKRDILSDVLMVINDNLSKQATKTSQQLTQEDRSEKKQEAGVPGGQGPPTPTVEEPEKKGQLDTAASDKANDQTDKVPEKNTETLDAFIKETIDKVQRYIQPRIERQLVINGIVDKIKTHLQSQKTLVIILKVDHKYVTEWEQTRNALSLLLPRVAIVMILKKTDNVQKRAKEEYCDPPEEPIDYSSLSAIYHDIVLEITSQQKNRGNYDPQIFRTILEQCEPYEFCMKVFAHTLYAKPKKSKEELHKLQSDLQELSPKSSRNSATKMLKFSYRDLPKEYKSCFLYLAIFPRGHQIRRSTLIGRWVAEGLITTEDWRWSTSVHKAEKCFDALINKWLIYPAEISATGRVKSCTVGDLVHEFITKIAKKQRIVETRLSHHLARHFSIFNDVHLRGSDKIDKFLERLSGSHQWCRLKVLDLEGCKCFEKKRRYLKNICNNISLLKYLSLRETDIIWLPSEINNLRELEVLDIRQTKVAKSATKGLLLLKLKRLLAGHTNPSGDAGTSFPSHVLIPEKIEKMLDMEVLSNVKAQSSQDLKDIGKLWQLSKLGVVIEDKDHHKNLLQAISNLHECLRSLSITIEISKDSPKALGPIEQKKKHYVPKVLERLNITGIVVDKDLLDLLATSKTPLTKVTLSKTSLSRTVLELLSNSLPELCSLRLRHNTYTDDKLTFMKGEFQKLKYFLVEGSNNIEISFDNAAAPELEKIVLSFSNLQHINGVEHLSKLQELELITSTKSTNNNGGITGLADAAPSTPTIPDHLAAITATDHTPAAASAATPAVNDPAPSTAATANLAPSAPAASSPAPTNDPVPSAATTTGTPHSAPTTTSAAGTISPPSAPTTAAPTAAGANDPPVPSSTTATCPTPSAPSSTTTATIPSSSTSTTSNNNRVLFSKLLSDAKNVTKVTLRGTMLKQDDLQFLAGMANLRCLVLLDGSYDGRELVLGKYGFPKLNILVVHCYNINGIKFESGSSPKLKKIAWTFEKMDSFSGIENLPRLKELDFNGHSIPDQVKSYITKHEERIHYTHYIPPESQDQIEEKTEKEHGAPSCPFIWKDKGWRWWN